ncbi:carbohydrate porin (plasmid) [Microvirga terrae]|uniref:Carbohydrate porin n=1 Tax=Microvirga terrae TaxID=2740529 RepID=A0ABY5RZC1_9HYPH|nr:carbohydrate porin [Microvirga terrae]UVF22202.1 carbohydrate porin [Microvirga terrae]
MYSTARGDVWSFRSVSALLAYGVTTSLVACGAAAQDNARPLRPPEPCSASETLASTWTIQGFPKDLDTTGLQLCVNYTAEALANLKGGVRTGPIYEGKLEGIVHADLHTLVGWPGATIHANFLQIHGRGLSRYYLSNLLTVSGIEALPSTRLQEVWLEQEIGTWASIRIGQMAVDSEFLTSSYAGLFVNATFGWPAITAAALPSGGPAYPLSAPGARIKVKSPDTPLTLLLAVFNGDPAGPGDADPQRLNRRGTNFRLDDPPLYIGEAQYTYNSDNGARSLPGTLKVGTWYHTAQFNDLRFDAGGFPLADPESLGQPARHRGNQGVYGVLDQTLWRDRSGGSSGEYSGPEVGMFTRLSFSPADRSLINFYADAGLSFKGLVPTRKDDVFGIAFGYGSISSRARGFDRDTAFFSRAPTVIRDYEAVLEMTYQLQLANGWFLQPDFQYIFHPGGHVPDPKTNPVRALRDEAVAGIRMIATY